jgi:hypothetical protein
MFLAPGLGAETFFVSVSRIRIKAMSMAEFVATSTPKITAYVDEAIDRAVDGEAAKERRSRSQMVAILIEEALLARGHQFAPSVPPPTETPTSGVGQ